MSGNQTDVFECFCPWILVVVTCLLHSTCLIQLVFFCLCNPAVLNLAFGPFFNLYDLSSNTTAFVGCLRSGTEKLSFYHQSVLIHSNLGRLDRRTCFPHSLYSLNQRLVEKPNLSLSLQLCGVESLNVLIRRGNERKYENK